MSILMITETQEKYRKIRAVQYFKVGNTGFKEGSVKYWRMLADKEGE